MQCICIYIQKMKNRVSRQLAIKQIITSSEIHSQDELLVKLHAQGFDLTQATLSRDLKALKVAKVPSGDLGYMYVIPEGMNVESRDASDEVNFLADGFRDLSFSGNLAVMRTRPGYASSIAAVLDNAEPYECYVTGIEVTDKHITVLATIKDSMEEVFCQSPFELGASNIDWLNQMYEAVRLQLENTNTNS